MLLKSRHEFTLCFFLFAPLGMAGYAAETLDPGSSGVEGNIPSNSVRNLTTQSGSNDRASAPQRGGQAEPASAAGGSAGADRVSRLIVDGRKAYRDGDLKNARVRFQEALSLDGVNAEAKRYLGEIERHSDGSQFTADAPLEGVPVRRNTPAPAVETAKLPPATSNFVKQEMKPSTGQVAVNASESMGSEKRFSRTVAQADSFAAPVTAALKQTAKPVAEPKVAKADTKVADVKKPDAVAAASKTSDAPAEKAAPVIAAKPKADSAPVVLASKEAPKAAAKTASERKADALLNAPAGKSAPASADLVREDLLAAFDGLKAEAMEIASAAKPQAAEHPAGTAPSTNKTAPAAEKPDAEKKPAAEAKLEVPKEAPKAPAAKAEAPKADAKADLPKAEAKAEVAKPAPVEKKADAKSAKPDAAALAKAQAAADAANSIKPKDNAKALDPDKKATADNKPEVAKASDLKAAPAKAEVTKPDAKPEAPKSEAKAEVAKADAKSNAKATEAKAPEANGAEKATKSDAPAEVASAAAEKPKQSTEAAEPKQAKAEPTKATLEANAGIKLYNAGKYSEAADKLKAVLASEPDNADAKTYLARAEKKIASTSGKSDAAANTPPLLDISKLTKDPIVTAQAAGGEKESVKLAQAPVELKPLSEALSKEASKTDTKSSSKSDDKKSDSEKKTDDAKKTDDTKKTDEAKSPSNDGPKADTKPAAGSATPNATDPIVEADKLLRQAQRELQDGKREDALSTARKAAALDANNVEAKALVSDLSGNGSGSQAKGLPSLQSVTAPAPVVPSATAVPVAPVTAPVTTADSLPPLATGATGAATAANSPALPPTGVAPAGIDALLTEGRNKFQAGRLRESLTSFKAVLEKDPTNPEAKDYVMRIEAESGAAPAVADASDATPDSAAPAVGLPEKGEPKPEKGFKISSQQKAADAESAFQQGLVAYQAGRLDVAVQHWNYALTMDRNHPRAIQYLEQTRSEYDAWVQQHQYNALELQKEVVATEKLDTPVTYDTSGQKTIVEFLSAMSLITDISFYVTDGVDPEIRITAKFEDQPLHDALDVVMLPIGLKWSRTADVITITPDLRTKFFNLTPEQVGRLKALLENKTLQRYLYGPEGVPPMRNVELTLDDRENLLSVTDSQENINKIESFVKDLQAHGPTQLVYRNWKIRPEEGAKIKALVEAIVRVQSDAPFDLERKVMVDGDDLIVKDTAENVSKIEQLLLDKNFLRKLETQKLSVASYNLTPREPLKDNVEQVRDLAQSVVTVVKTILYAQSTESAAAAEGRRYWFDPNTLQLTVTDFPENLRVVGDYIRSLPMLGSDQAKSEIIFLKHQTSAEMVDLLTRVLGLGGDTGGGTETATGNSVSKSLRVEGELTFRDLKIRITKVNENDVNDDNDDSVEMVIRTATTSEDRTIEEFRSDFIDEYELNVIEVRPSNTPGEGNVRLEIRYNPQGINGQGGGAVTPVGGVVPGVGGVGGAPVIGPDGQIIQPVVQAAEDETTLQVEPIDNMNALLVRYDDPADLAQVKSWLEQLDIPVLQVSIETKLVEVNETRVKQFMPKFNILNLGQGGPDFSNNVNSLSGLQEGGSILNNTFEDPALPLAWNQQNADLLNPVSVFNIITGGDSPLNFTLRMLETEGVLNMVNGPHITVENGESATFEIELTTPGLARSVQNLNQGGQQGGGQGIQAGGNMQQVDMEVTPQITQLGEIRLQIDNLELNDRGHHLADPTTIHLDLSGDGAGQPPEPVVFARAFGGTLFDNRRRALQTVARVQNHGTIVLGGWTGERSLTRDAGLPILRNLPYIGKLLFGQTADEVEKTNLLIFLTCHLIEP